MMNSLHANEIPKVHPIQQLKAGEY